MKEPISFTVSVEESGERLDKLLTLHADLSRSALQGIIESGNASVNGIPRQKNFKVTAGDQVEIQIPEAQPYEAEAEDIPLDIVYEDRDLLVVNKPKGMVVHPAAGNYTGTLVNALLYHCKGSLSGINGVMRPGIVHRIDKDTSGLLMVAKNDRAHQHLAEQIKEHSFHREYEAVVQGNLKQDNGRIDLPIGRHPVHRKKMAVTEKNSKNAVTHYEVVHRYRGYTHVRLRLETGRTHQIRVHMSSLGHPLAGDTVYGGKEVAGFAGQCLHAKRIGFLHPVTEDYLEFDSSLPDWFDGFLSKLSE